MLMSVLDLQCQTETLRIQVLFLSFDVGQLSISINRKCILEIVIGCACYCLVWLRRLILYGG